jgi:hypothetical protein
VWAGSEVIDYGTTGASSNGTTVVGGVSSAEGSFTQITASTTRSHYYIAAGLGCAADTIVQAESSVLDIGVGAATEDVIAEDLRFGSSVQEEMFHPPLGIFAQIPASTRLTARISNLAAAAQSFDVILYGVS